MSACGPSGVTLLGAPNRSVSVTQLSPSAARDDRLLGAPDKAFAQAPANLGGRTELTFCRRLIAIGWWLLGAPNRRRTVKGTIS